MHLFHCEDLRIAYRVLLIALTARAYVWEHQRSVGVTAVVTVAIVNVVGGLTRTVAVTQILLAAALVALAAVIRRGLVEPHDVALPAHAD